ncbi:hypothetical protein Ancab_008118, partial [Ancistrocladus abbreviatus]
CNGCCNGDEGYFSENCIGPRKSKDISRKWRSKVVPAMDVAMETKAISTRIALGPGSQRIYHASGDQR